LISGRNEEEEEYLTWRATMEITRQSRTPRKSTVQDRRSWRFIIRKVLTQKHEEKAFEKMESMQLVDDPEDLEIQQLKYLPHQTKRHLIPHQKKKNIQHFP
jgi:hypothetical protein